MSQQCKIPSLKAPDLPGNILATKRRDRASINSRQTILRMISRIRVPRNYRTRTARINQKL